MEITYLGHAGFLVETGGAIVVADPWLSPTGAFDRSWMQLPQNHQLAPMVRERLSDPRRERFLYVSHEHKDHFDPAFLASVPDKDGITVVVPRFGRAVLRERLAELGFRRVVACRDGDEVPIPGGSLKLFVEDAGHNRDSALLVRADGRTFLDLNDCKLHDRIAKIAADEGAIDLFTAQFSGAIWHPVCYAYDPKAYAAVTKRKMFSKFEAVARAIELLKPSAFVASAGPACFLDPELLRFNFEPVSIFVRAPKFFAWLERRLRDGLPRLVEAIPGDVLDPAAGAIAREGPGERVTDQNFEAYVRAYADRMAPVLAERRRELSRADAEQVFERLQAELARKLDALTLRERIGTAFYAGVEELPEKVLRIDFPRGRMEVVPGIREERRYTFHARAADLVPVLDRALNWEDFLLSLRHRMSRFPDAYDALIHGFLAVEAEDLSAYCDHVLESEARQERTIVTVAGIRRYAINRYCPHQGADLSEGWVEGLCVTCPRHRWQFDLENHGRCTFNNTSIHAVAVPFNHAVNTVAGVELRERPGTGAATTAGGVPRGGDAVPQGPETPGGDAGASA